MKANIVPRGVGNRVTKRSTKVRMANLRVKRFVVNGAKVKLVLCSSCLKRIKKDAADMKKQPPELSAVKEA